MHISRSLIGTCAFLSIGLCLAGRSGATVYPDTVGDNTGPSYVDIASVQITNDLANLYVQITLTGDISISGSTDWGNYHIGFDTGPGGSTSISGPWGNPIGMSSGMDFWVGSWVNWGGGASLYQWDGSSWTQIGSPSVSLAQYSETITIPLASLGLSNGSTFDFDVWSTFGNPGGQSAYDASSNPSMAVADPWNGTPYDSGSLVSTYTVPEPALGTVLAVAGVALIGRRRS